MPTEYKLAYEYGKKVSSEEIIVRKAGEEITAQTGMNTSSAKIYVTAARNMIRGVLFTRAISRAAAEYYLINIKKDFGEERLQKAAFSLEEFVKYCERTTKQKLPGMRKIVAKYKDGATTFDEIDDKNEAIEDEGDKEELVLGGENLIVYGAPGSGKSYLIDNLTQDQNPIRVVFHAEYQNTDFVGGLKPYKENDQITYAFIPGPFINALLQAIQNPSKHTYLIIEEINRANAAAVFGEVFQLLDRNEAGTSIYAITPEKMLKTYLQENRYPEPENLKIPPNLSILATMNSSDQGVFPLDSAFKRRWGFKYCPIDFKTYAAKPSFTEKILPYNDKHYSWTEFATAINDTLKGEDIEEDRLIGPYFLTNQEREDEESIKDAVAGKLLIYLWDDVLRHGLRDRLFDPQIKTFSDLVNTYQTGGNIFRSIFTDTIEETPENDE